MLNYGCFGISRCHIWNWKLVTASSLWALHIISLFHAAIDRHFYGYAACPSTLWCLPTSICCHENFCKTGVSFPNTPILLFMIYQMYLFSFYLKQCTTIYHRYLHHPRIIIFLSPQHSFGQPGTLLADHKVFLQPFLLRIRLEDVLQKCIFDY